MSIISSPRSLTFQPLIGETGTPCAFGVMVTPNRTGMHIGELSTEWLRIQAHTHQLVVLRGFDSFDSTESLTRYCNSFGNIMMWPFGAVLELVEQSAPNDHIFANSYVPLHWDGMYLATVPEFQIFQCVHAVDETQGGRTTFASTTEALRMATPEVRQLWEGARGYYERSVELYSNKVDAPIIDRHPRREFPVLKFCEPPIENDEAFLNPSLYRFSRADGGPPQELVESLKSALYDPQVYYAHQWCTGDMVIADNLSLLHGREQFASQSGRHLRRVHIHATPPFENPHLETSK